MTVDELLATLRERTLWPRAAPAGEPIQTHISIVAIAGDEVFKFKKPVRLPFLDFSTLPRREHFCREEVRLNRRLCPDVYRGVAAIVRTPQGLRLVDDPGPGSDVVEWAVHMTRLPADRMLDRLVAGHAVHEREIAALARRIANFHASADRGEAVLRHGDPQRLAGFARANFGELQQLQQVPSPLLDALRQQCERDFARLVPVLQRRAQAGRVVDGHGDLHARNVCMIEPPAVYDCIEFEPAFRCGDVATDVAFLVMDLRFRGAPRLAAAFAAAYADAAHDDELHELLPPLVQYRALVRSKVAATAAREHELPPAQRAASRAAAARYLLLAGATAADQGARRWLVLCGPPASGKSALAELLHDVAGWPVVATDRVRKELAGVAPTARAPAAAYEAAFSDRTYAEVARRAAAARAAGAATVLLDGNFATPGRRQAAIAAARAAGAQPIVVHVAVDEATALQRLRARQHDASAVSDAGPAEHAMLRARFAPPAAAEGAPVVALDGTRELPQLAAGVLHAMLEATPQRAR